MATHLIQSLKKKKRFSCCLYEFSMYRVRNELFVYSLPWSLRE